MAREAGEQQRIQQGNKVTKKLPLETEDSCSALIHISKKRLSEEEKTSGKSLLDNSSDDVTGQFPEEASASVTALRHRSL
ncbi:hypothetical protein ACROYT_G025023 [Oculina patagonica]